MSPFFKGRPRKLGCLLLVVVFPFLLGWVRSFTQADFVGLSHGGSTLSIVSHDGMLNFERLTPLSSVHPVLNSTRNFAGHRKTVITVTEPSISKSTHLYWGTQRLQWFNEMIGVRTTTVDVVWNSFDVEWQRNIGPLESVAGNDGVHRAVKVVLPYSLVVLPLVLVASILLFKKPQKEARKKTVEFTANECA